MPTSTWNPPAGLARPGEVIACPYNFKPFNNDGFDFNPWDWIFYDAVTRSGVTTGSPWDITLHDDYVWVIAPNMDGTNVTALKTYLDLGLGGAGADDALTVGAVVGETCNIELTPSLDDINTTFNVGFLQAAFRLLVHGDLADDPTGEWLYFGPEELILQYSNNQDAALVEWVSDNFLAAFQGMFP